MATLIISVISLFLTLAIAMQVHGTAQDPESVKKWFSKLAKMEEKTTSLHFYFRDVLSGKKTTAFLVAGKNTTSTTPVDFTAVMMADDPLTVGPDPSSEEIGRAQGMYSQAAMADISFLMNFNLVFTKGEYNGSTLSLVGRNPILNEYREMSIVGGSGIFRLARGIATAKTYVFDPASLNAIVEYHVVVIYYV